MAWPANFPLTEGADLQDWDGLWLPLLKRFLEKGQATQCTFPRASHAFYSGTIYPGALTETTYTEPSGTTFCGGTDDVSGNSYAVPWNCTLASSWQGQTPGPWAFVIDPWNNDPSKIIIVNIASWTNTRTFTFASSLRDYFTSGQTSVTPIDGNSAADLSSLTGKNYYVIGYQRKWWSDRVFEWPNPQEYAKGTVESSTSTSSPVSQTTLTDTTLRLGKDALKGKHLLCYSDESPSRLKRFAVTSNTSDTIVIAHQSWKPKVGTSYCVVTANRMALPGRGDFFPFWWYRMVREGFASHQPDDTLGSAQMPAASITATGADGFGGCTITLKTFDKPELWSESDGLDMSPDDISCSRPRDFCYSLDGPKTIRGMQILLEELCASYYDPTGGIAAWNGVTRFPKLNAAETFKLAGINSFTGTTGAIPGGPPNNTIAISGFSFPAGTTFPIQCHFSIHRPDQDQNHGGRGYLTNSTTLVAEISDEFSSSNDESQTCVISFGWSRFVELAIMRLLDGPTGFVPFVSVDEFGTAHAVDPPEVIDFAMSGCDGVGSFQAPFPASTHYIERKIETNDWTQVQGFAYENGPAIANGDIVRFVGDNFFDPTIKDGIATTGTGHFSKSADGDVLAPYYEHFYNGEVDPTHQFARLNQQIGVATEECDTFFVRDSRQDWFDFQWFGAFMRYEEGTFTSGSTLSGTDSSKASGAANCFWADPARFGGANPYVFGAVVEMDLDDDGVFETFRVVSSSSPSAVSVTWTQATSQPVSGHAYRIPECRIHNRYKKRQITVWGINPDSGAYEHGTSTIVANGQDTLFFSPPLPFKVRKGYHFYVNDPRPGGVWKATVGSTSTSWSEVVDGDDATRLGVQSARSFHANSRENLPHLKKRYGRFLENDICCIEVFNELKAFMDVLKITGSDCAWKSNAVDAVDENNHKAEGVNPNPCLTYFNCAGLADCGHGTGTPCAPTGEQDAYQLATGAWAGTAADHEGDAPPYCYSIAHFTQNVGSCHPCGTTPADGCSEYSLARRWSYLACSDLCQRVAATAYGFAYALAANSQETSTCAGAGVDVIFNDNGDGVAYKAFGAIGSAAVVNGKARIKVGGGLGLPAGALPNGTTCQDRDEGYTVTDQRMLIVWSFS